MSRRLCGYRCLILPQHSPPLRKWKSCAEKARRGWVMGKRIHATHSIGTKSLTIMLPIVIIPPAPRPQSARANIKLVMLSAKAHHSVASMKMVMVTT